MFKLFKLYILISSNYLYFSIIINEKFISIFIYLYFYFFTINHNKLISIFININLRLIVFINHIYISICISKKMFSVFCNFNHFFFSIFIQNKLITIIIYKYISIFNFFFLTNNYLKNNYIFKFLKEI